MNEYEVEWRDGVKTHLTRLDQRATYSGMLEGIPTLYLNEKFFIQPLIANGSEPRILLWAPQERLEDWTETFMDSPTAALPSVTCIARFESLFPACDQMMATSYIEVVWFQEEWALPIISEVLVKIKSLNWRDVAIDDEP